MLALVQRVRSARVEVAQQVVGAIGPGLLLFVCAEPADGDAHADRLAERVLKLRVFGDAEGKMSRSVQDIAGGVLVVSQFTLAADTARGNRPSFHGAAPAALAERLCQRVVEALTARHAAVATGRFGADMQVHLVNDGPVTVPLTLR